MRASDPLRLGDTMFSKARSSPWGRPLLILVCFLAFLFAAARPATAQEEEETQSVVDAARAARARHAQPVADVSAPTKHAPFSQTQLVAWQIAGMPVPDLLAEVKANGIAFAPDDTNLAPLKDAQLPADLIAALPTVPSQPEAGTPAAIPQPLIAASQAFNSKDYPGAITLLEPLTQQTPDADLFAALGNLQFLSNDTAAAKTAFEQAVQLDPSFLYAHMRLAEIYYSLENGALAAAEAKKVLQLQPDNAQARRYLALSLSMKLQATNAAASGSSGGGVEDLSDLANNPGVSQEAKDLNNQALVFMDQQEWNKAETNLKKAIAMEPNVALFYYNLGNLYSKWGRHNVVALDAYKKAKALAPRNLAVRQNYGHFLCSEHAYEAAITEFQELLDMDPSWNIARPCLYEALYAMNRKTEAARVLNEYREWNHTLGLPDDSDEIDLEKKEKEMTIDKGGVHL